MNMATQTRANSLIESETMDWPETQPLRQAASYALVGLFALMTLGALSVLGFLLYEIFSTGFARLSFDFLDSFPSRFAHKAGLKSALYGSAWMMGLTALIAIPLGVGTSIWLVEYGGKSTLQRLVESNISNLAAVPSVVFGILGLVVFVRTLSLGPSLIAGALTMSLLILPILVVACRQALLNVPQSVRAASYAVGATKWQTVRHHVLPAAIPSMMTGVILSLSRAVGETAPLIVVGAAAYVAFLPETPMDSFSTLPIQIFNWASRPQAAFHEVAAAGIIVLLAVLLAFNAVAILIRTYFQRKAH